MNSDNSTHARQAARKSAGHWENGTGVDPAARVHPSAELGNDVSVGPFAIIGPGVELGDGVEIEPHAVVEQNTTVGAGTRISSHAVIGTDPQDRGYDGEETFCEIGEECDIREYVTVNRSSKEGGTTKVGDDCLLMATVHIAHDCKVGDSVTMANLATLGGHCVVEDGAVLGGMAVAHQFVRIGKYAMIGGTSGLMQDVPPFMMAFGKAPARIVNINHVGLKRNGYSRDDRQLLRSAFRLLYREGHSTGKALEEIRGLETDNTALDHLCEFIEESSRGICSAVPKDVEFDRRTRELKRKDGESESDYFDELTASLPAT